MAAIFLFSALPPPSYIFFLLYLLFKYIWFTYVFSTDKGPFSSFITKAPNMLKNHSPRRPLCRPKPVKKTMQILFEAGPKLDPCFWFEQRIAYWGLKISGEGIRPNTTMMSPNTK